MFSKTKKNNKREASPEPEMIEMEDLSGKPVKPEQVGINFSESQSEVNVEYPELTESAIKNEKQNRSQGNQGQKYPSTLPQYAGKPYPQPQQYPSQVRDSAIRMNGMTFQAPNQPQPVQKKRSRVPEMTVVCRFCTLKQLVAGNSHIFICSVCDNMNECRPLYNLFICCGCHTQVCYQLGVSQMIRCTRCRTVNRVPINIAPTHTQQQYRQLQQQRDKQIQQRRPSQLPQQQPSKPAGQQETVQRPPEKQVWIEEEVVIHEEPRLMDQDRDHTNKKQFEQHQPDLLQFDEESWNEPAQQQQNLLPATQQTTARQQ